LLPKLKLIVATVVGNEAWATGGKKYIYVHGCLAFW